MAPDPSQPRLDGRRSGGSNCLKSRGMEGGDVETWKEATPGGGGPGAEEEEQQRLYWDSKLQYLFMLTSYSVGLSVIWRFPYLSQKHGGGAFLIPYLVMVLVEGVPLLYLELAIGQRMRSGAVGVWNQVHPLVGGLGFAAAVSTFNVVTYFNAILAWGFFYLFSSFQSPLPWSSCPSYTTDDNMTLPVPECDLSGPTSYFWYREALDISTGIDESDGIRWKILGCHFFAWIVVYLCVCKGIKSSGKVIYLATSLPYVIQVLFLVRGVTLEGSVDGLVYLFTPEMDHLLSFQPWFDAASQIFFSFGMGFGGLVSFASYNSMHNNVRKDTLIISVTNVLASILSCLVTFAIIGFKATVMYRNCLDHNIQILGDVCSNAGRTDTVCAGYNSSATVGAEILWENFEEKLPVLRNLTLQTFRACNREDDLKKGVEGTGLLFIAFTQAINEFGESAPFWSVVFFLMLILIGMGAQFGAIDSVMTSLCDLDLFPWMKKKWLLAGVLSTLWCAIGVLFTQGSGLYWLELFDTFVTSFPVIFVALGEALVVGWLYGFDRFADDIEFMLGSRPGLHWKLAWKFVAPAALISLLVGSVVSQFSKPIGYSAYNSDTTLMESAPYPWYASVVCAVIVLSSGLWLPGIALARKFGWSQYDQNKALAAKRYHATDSTVAICNMPVVRSCGSEARLDSSRETSNTPGSIHLGLTNLAYRETD